jgi:hypothetical protein
VTKVKMLAQETDQTIDTVRDGCRFVAPAPLIDVVALAFDAEGTVVANVLVTTRRPHGVAPESPSPSPLPPTPAASCTWRAYAEPSALYSDALNGVRLGAGVRRRCARYDR